MALSRESIGTTDMHPKVVMTNKRKDNANAAQLALAWFSHLTYFFGRPPHISSSAKGWIGPLGFGLGRDLITASAK